MTKNRLWWSIAWRFLRAKNKTQVINILTALSVIAVTALIAAFVIIVSVFNGFDSHFKELYSGLYPDIVIRSQDSTTFTPDPALTEYLHSQENLTYSPVLETRAFVDYEGKQAIVKLRGVDTNYLDIVELDISSAYENKKLNHLNEQFCYYSFSTAEALGLNINFDLIPIQVQIPKYSTSKQITNLVSSAYLYPKGAYTIEESQGEKDMLANYSYIENLSGQYGKVTELAVKVGASSSIPSHIQKIQKKFPGLYILSSDQQNESLYKIINTERYMVYAILIFMLLLSSLNIIGVLLMTIIEKQKDIALFGGLGADKPQIQGIFLRLGTLIGVVGVMLGLIIGLTFALGQQEFGWIKMDTQQVLVREPFPVQVQWLNIAFIAMVGLVISVLSSWLPSRYVTSSMSSLRWSD